MFYFALLFILSCETAHSNAFEGAGKPDHEDRQPVGRESLRSGWVPGGSDGILPDPPREGRSDVENTPFASG